MTDNIIIFLILAVIVLIYFYAFVYLVLRMRSSNERIVKMHNAIISVYQNCDDISAGILQLEVNYKQIIQKTRDNKDTSLIDTLESIIYYYDTFSDNNFNSFFKHEKDSNIRSFIYEVYCTIKRDNTFASVPAKEAQLLKTLSTAIDNNNIDLGQNTLKQLSDEIINKEMIIRKKEKENRLAIIVSIVGILLTLFFGILSIKNIF